MPYPTDVGVIDTMLDIPVEGRREKWYEFLEKQLRDEGSKDLEMPAGYMFKQVPQIESTMDPVDYVIAQMDHFNIDKALIGAPAPGMADRDDKAFTRHGDRFLPHLDVNPNLGMDAVRAIQRAFDEQGIVAVGAFPAGCFPQVPINDKKFFPVYAKCAELGLPIFVCAGVPGPRLPFECQYVGHIDEVCWYFPELTFVTRHGCEPWADLAVKLMLKWPNLYYSTSAFAPKYYPTEIIDYANTRGADKVLYAGYFPMGLSLERIFGELPDVGFNDDVWPKFLRGNAWKILKLDHR